MVFSSITFLYYFLPLFFIIYIFAPSKYKNAVLLAASLVFYAWGEPVYILLMVFSTVFNYFCGIYIEKSEYLKSKRAIAAFGIAVNVCMLFFFKYADFAIQTVNTMFGAKIKSLNMALPIGISFYTFQTMSYIIDVYRGDVCAQRNFTDFAAYVTMFPQLIAGPIVRYSSIEEQLSKRKVKSKDITDGILRFCIGLAKKVLIANNIGELWNFAYQKSMSGASVMTFWLGVLAYALQIYYDFSGYSDMAIGLGKILSFKFPENFKYPYISSSVSEFWRRWHITLGTWFKEYVYFPLGGSRGGIKRTVINLIVVWFLTGLWHGASCNFVIWGLYYGVLLILEKFVWKTFLKNHKKAGYIYTLLAVSIGWVFFASGNLTSAFNYLLKMIGIGAKGFADGEFLYNVSSNALLLIIAVAGCTPLFKNICKRYIKSDYIKIVFSVLLIILCTAYLINSTYNPFLYFRF